MTKKSNIQPSGKKCHLKIAEIKMLQIEFRKENPLVSSYFAISIPYKMVS